MKINYELLPIKAHYFFLCAATGAIFPFLPVYGKQLGISPLIMGSITAILPILYVIAKPIFGFIMDYFQTQKKIIFMTILIITSSSYILLYFLPSLPETMVSDHQFQNFSCASLPSCGINSNSSIASYNDTTDITCHWVCKDRNFSVQLSFHAIEEEVVISPNTTCLINIDDVSLCSKELKKNHDCDVICDNFENNHYLYTSVTFWGFVLLMSLGNIGSTASLTITNAICLNILGKGKEMKYGKQHVWGEIGFGLAAFLTGFTVNVWSEGRIYKTYTSAFLLVFIFICIDLICCRKLKLPLISRSTNIFADICAVLKLKPVVIFLCFAIIVGSLEGYMISFLLWYEEDLAIKTGYMDKIKLIEGITVGAQALSCTILLFLSDEIWKKLGYGYTFTLSLVFYILRLGLISVAPTPWWIILIEFLMVGSSFALSHVTIVAFVNVMSSSSRSSVSVSVQGIISAMKDGFGPAIGNLVGSILLRKFGGAVTLQIFSIFAAFCALVYFLLYITYLKPKISETLNNIGWKEPDEARKHCLVPDE